MYSHLLWFILCVITVNGRLSCVNEVDQVEWYVIQAAQVGYWIWDPLSTGHELKDQMLPLAKRLQFRNARWYNFAKAGPLNLPDPDQDLEHGNQSLAAQTKQSISHAWWWCMK